VCDILGGGLWVRGAYCGSRPGGWVAWGASGGRGGGGGGIIFWLFFWGG